MSESLEYILDSYAILAYFNGEAQGRRVMQVLREAESGKCRLHLSLINLGEVLYIIERERGLLQAQEVISAMQQLPIDLVEVDQEAVFEAAHIKANYRISYADAFVVTAAQRLDASILTGDPEFGNLKGSVKIDWL